MRVLILFELLYKLFKENLKILRNQNDFSKKRFIRQAIIAYCFTLLWILFVCWVYINWHNFSLTKKIIVDILGGLTAPVGIEEFFSYKRWKKSRENEILQTRQGRFS